MQKKVLFLPLLALLLAGCGKTTVLPESITISGARDLLVGEEVTLSAEILPIEADQKITWTTDAPQIATVSSAGLVKAISKGSVNITATSQAKTEINTYTTIVVSEKDQTVKEEKVVELDFTATNLTSSYTATTTLENPYVKNSVDDTEFSLKGSLNLATNDKDPGLKMAGTYKNAEPGGHMNFTFEEDINKLFISLNVWAGSSDMQFITKLQLEKAEGEGWMVVKNLLPEVSTTVQEFMIPNLKAGSYRLYVEGQTSASTTARVVISKFSAFTGPEVEIPAYEVSITKIKEMVHLIGDPIQDLKSYVRGNDEDGNDVTNLITVEHAIDYNTPDTYKVTYKLSVNNKNITQIFDFKVIGEAAQFGKYNLDLIDAIGSGSYGNATFELVSTGTEATIQVEGERIMGDRGNNTLNTGAIILSGGAAGFSFLSFVMPEVVSEVIISTRYWVTNYINDSTLIEKVAIEELVGEEWNEVSDITTDISQSKTNFEEVKVNGLSQKTFRIAVYSFSTTEKNQGRILVERVSVNV